MINRNSPNLQLLSLENTIKIMKYKPQPGRKYFQMFVIPDKEIVSRIGKELIKINKKKKKKNVQKMRQRFEQIPHQRSTDGR